MKIIHPITDKHVIALIVLCAIFTAINLQPVVNSTQRMMYKISYAIYKKPPTWAIIKLFDNYADDFDQHLTHILNYTTPRDITAFILGNSDLRHKEIRVLDLGCGTGLLAEQLNKSFTLNKTVGVDFSKKMLRKAQIKKLYHELHHKEISVFLEETDELYDLITATDVLIYIGDLHDLFASTYAHLTTDGYFAFSIELLDSGTFDLTNSGRYAHSIAYILDLSKKIGYNNITTTSTTLRKEFATAVKGQLFLMQK